MYQVNPEEHAATQETNQMTMIGDERYFMCNTNSVGTSLLQSASTSLVLCSVFLCVSLLNARSAVVQNRQNMTEAEANQMRTSV